MSGSFPTARSGKLLKMEDIPGSPLMSKIRWLDGDLSPALRRELPPIMWWANHSVAGQDFTPIGCTRLFHGSTHLGRIISLMLRGGSLPLIAVITQCSSRH